MLTIPESLQVAFARHREGKLDEAEQLYQQILVEEPRQVDAQHLLGVIAHQRGMYAMAINHIGRAVELAPERAVFHTNLASTNFALGRIEPAIDCLRTAVRLQPELVKAHNDLGVVLANLGRLDEAADSFREVVRLRPGFAPAYNNLGNVLSQLGRQQEATEYFQTALRLQPDFAEAHDNLGNTLRALGRHDEAIDHYRQAIACNANYATAYYNLAIAQKEAGFPEEAIHSYREAIRIRPDFGEAMYNLGSLLQDQRQLAEALDCFRQAARQKANFAEAHNNAGAILQEQGADDDAIVCYRDSIAARGDFAESHYNLATVYLSQGNFAAGWPEFEWRLKCARHRPRRFDRPQWQGEPLDGRTLLVHAEQGLGDTFMFVRYLRELAGHGGTIFFEAQPSLVPLLKSSGIENIVVAGGDLPPFDLHVPLLSLPGILQTTLDNVPHAVPYLAADEHLVARWRERLAEFGGFKVGIGWQGNRDYLFDHNRSIALKHFEPLARVAGVQLFSLQKGDGREQLAELGPTLGIHDLADELDRDAGAFMDTAAVIKNLDLVITSDTALPNLAGALAAPTWVALPFAPDWRWLRRRSDSPWYPTLRLFRQGRLGAWDVAAGRDCRGTCRDGPRPRRLMQRLTPMTSDAFELALEYQRTGRLEQAETLCREVIAGDPRHAPARYLLGRLARLTGRVELAAEQFSAAIALAPDEAGYHCALGEALLALKRNEEACESFARASDCDANLVEARWGLAAALRAAGDAPAAAAAYRQVLQLKPDHWLVHNELGGLSVEAE